MTGFVDSAGHAQGTPVGVGLDKTGSLLVTDDVDNTIWRAPSGTTATHESTGQ